MALLISCWLVSADIGVAVLQHCAVASPHPKRKQVTELLLRKGANINDKNKE